MSQNHERNQIRWKLLLTLVLASIALVAAVAGTTAWLTSDRSLTTLTKINFVTLTLEGKTTDSEPVNLGTLEVGKTKEMPFRIVTKKNAEYVLQLAHTTNLPLNYEIYEAKADPWGTKTDTCVKTADAAEKTYHSETYNGTDAVQKNAEPLYWISSTRKADANTGIDYYVLVVSWKDSTTKESITNKDTEMVYLSASLLGGADDAETSEP